RGRRRRRRRSRRGPQLPREGPVGRPAGALAQAVRRAHGRPAPPGRRDGEADVKPRAKRGKPMSLKLPRPWQPVVGEELEKPYFDKLRAFLDEERAHHKAFPPADKVFSALELTPYENVSVLIVGQDPYHDDGQAHGLAFSVMPGVTPP